MKSYYRIPNGQLEPYLPHSFRIAGDPAQLTVISNWCDANTTGPYSEDLGELEFVAGVRYEFGRYKENEIPDGAVWKPGGTWEFADEIDAMAFKLAWT